MTGVRVIRSARRRCSYCGRLMPSTKMKRDSDCVEFECRVQHWMCRSEVSCVKEILRGRTIPEVQS